MCLAGLLALGSAACDNILDDDDDETFRVRAVHLIPDVATLRVRLDETAIASLGRLQGSSFTTAAPRNYVLHLEVPRPARLPGGDEEEEDEDPYIPIGDPRPHTFLNGVDYTLIVYGSFQEPEILALEGTAEDGQAPENRIIWRIVHAAPSLPAVDVYLTAPEAGIASPQLVRTLSHTEAIEPQELTIADEDDSFVDLTITLRARDTGELLYTSTQSRVSERERALFIITDNDGVGPSPARLVRISMGGSASAIFDVDERAEVRFVHVSPDTPALDIHILPGQSTPLAQNIAFRGSSDYRAVAPGEVNLIGVQSDNVGVFVLLEEFGATVSQSYTSYAVGPFSQVDSIVLGDDRRPTRAQTRFRFLHAASELLAGGRLDIYLTRRGEPLVFGDEEGEDDPVPRFSSVAYRTATEYVPFEAGEYDVYVTEEDSETISVGPIPIQTIEGSSHTLVLTHSEDGQVELIPIEDTRP